MNWCCLHFIRLPMEALSDADNAPEPWVITQGSRVMQCNRQATQLGIRAGMETAAARAIATGLRERGHCPRRESVALEQLAAWASQFSPRISLQPPRALLLEIGGSLKYFGGLESMRQRIRHGLDQVSHQAWISIAPTPTAAWLLARQGDCTPVLKRQELAHRLNAVPVTALELEPDRIEAIHGLGCHRIGDLHALPADSLARRLGRPLLATLQKAYGERPDPRVDWQAPTSFQAGIDIPTETTRRDLLRPGINHLLGALCGQLRRMEAGVMQLHCGLHHGDDPITWLTVGTNRPGRDPQRLASLLDQKLEASALPQGVTRLSIQVDEMHSLAPTGHDLLGDETGDGEAEAWHTLVENLGNRLGRERIQALTIHDEHRPEFAWRYAPPGEAADAPVPDTMARPAWLLAKPQRLTSQGGQPHYHGPLVIEQGPERIETGWWDGQDISRDYYQAVTPAGERLWVFRSRREPGHWYLHGLFS